MFNCKSKTRFFISSLFSMGSLSNVRLLRKQPRSQSILFFTQHKCASVFVSEILKTVVDTKKYKHTDYSNIIGQIGWFFSFGQKYIYDEEFFEQFGQKLFRDFGVIYGPLRHPFVIPHYQAFKSIFFLRDPRDSLISAYHSFGYTHSIPMDPDERKRFLKRRDWIQQNDIDAFCVQMAKDWSLPLLSGYRRLIELSIREPLVIKYEEFAVSPESVIIKILNMCKCQVSETEIKILSEKASPIQSNIQENSHKRSGQPGQYLIRLKSETIDEINKILHKELVYFNWA